MFEPLLSPGGRCLAFGLMQICLYSYTVNRGRVGIRETKNLGKLN